MKVGKKINNCVHSGWIRVEKNIWWKSIGSKLCSKCDEPKILFQNENCFRCQNEIKQNDYMFGIYGYYYQSNIYCQYCAKLMEINNNIIIKLINNEFQRGFLI